MKLEVWVGVGYLYTNNVDLDEGDGDLVVREEDFDPFVALAFNLR